MLAVLTVAEMRAADAASEVAEATLVRRAGTAVAHQAIRCLGGSAYGRRVVVLAGTGNNGADGRVAAAVLARRGAQVMVIEVGRLGRPPALPACHLVVDAVLGTGFRGSYEAPTAPPGAAVLAVDVPSGVDGDSGAAPGRVLAADVTVTFATWKPGLLQGEGPELCGQVRVADIGLAVGTPAVHLMEDADLLSLPTRARHGHKWSSAVAVVAGSPGMEGAAVLSSCGAARAGAGLVRLLVPGGGHAPWPVEAVRSDLPAEGWADEALEAAAKCTALVVGPGLGRSQATVDAVRSLVARCPVPVVVDADALHALGPPGAARAVLGARPGGHRRPVVLTPHDGEYEGLLGRPPSADRIAATRLLAGELGVVALVKGSLTAVGDAGGGDDGAVLLSDAGSPWLATAGSGDVLSGVIGAFIARGVPPFRAAALAALAHGRAAARGRPVGLVSPDLPELVSDVLSEADAAGEGGARHV